MMRVNKKIYIHVSWSIKIYKMAAVYKMATSWWKRLISNLNTNANVFFYCLTTAFIIQYGAINESQKTSKKREKEKQDIVVVKIVIY